MDFGFILYNSFYSMFKSFSVFKLKLGFLFRENRYVLIIFIKVGEVFKKLILYVKEK